MEKIKYWIGQPYTEDFELYGYYDLPDGTSSDDGDCVLGFSVEKEDGSSPPPMTLIQPYAAMVKSKQLGK